MAVRYEGGVKVKQCTSLVLALAWLPLACGAATPDEAAQAAGEAVQLQASQTVMDFGEVRPEARPERSLRVRNPSARPVRIASVHATCICTRAWLDSQTIPAEGEAVLRVGLDFQGYRSDLVRTRIILTPDDPNVEPLEILATATVLPEYRLEPDGVDFGRVKRGAPADQTVYVYQDGATPIEVIRVQGGRHVEAGLQQVPEKLRETLPEPLRTAPALYRISLWLSPEAPAGRLSERLSVETNAAR